MRLTKKSPLAEMLRTIPSPQYACVSCGECFDAIDLHWHPMKIRNNKIVIYAGWHCPICEPNTPVHERTGLNQFLQIN